ncbi:MAG: hypothetical protein CMH98_00035 [Oceanospirillaceae bacterium]|nr:hypothetical protein [Oceanospirillaceae bacterium]
MELVDANTKNYVFLTLSQYNDTQQLKRTRVSMRRDQPFWDGGNSYICCESFRVSSSPNQGGLYYKVFPPEWYMGCSIARDDQETSPEVGDFVPLEVPWKSNQGGQKGKHCAAANIVYDDDSNVSVAQVYTQDMAQNGDLSDFTTQDPTIIQEFLAKWVNHYHLTTGTWIRFQTIGNGADNENPGWYAGRLSKNPSATMSGNGYGPDRLYYPRFKIPAGDPPYQSILSNLTLLAQGGVNRLSVKIPINFHLWPQENLDADSDITEEELKIVTRALGTGMEIQMRTTHQAPHLWDPVITGPTFDVMGVAGVEYNFKQYFFTGVLANAQVGHCTGAPLLPMHYQELAVGATCWLEAYAGNTWNFPIGKVFGTITKVPVFTREAGYWAFPLHCVGSAALQTTVRDGAYTSDDQRTRLLQQDFMSTYDGTKVALGISAETEFAIRTDYNLTEDNNPATSWNMTQAKVYYAPNPHADEILCIRKPGADGAKYIYTPNEMFYAFNKPEPALGTLPYKLQTDENGGFVVRWEDSSTNPGTNFIISCALSQELGLNQYFEYDAEEFVDHKAEDSFFLLKQSRQPWLEDEQITTWINREDLSTTNPFNPEPALSKWTPAPVQPPDIGFGEGGILYDREGNEYRYISNHQFSRNRYAHNTQRIYPVIHTDEDGVEYFSYHDLPRNGRIGNTQMVSVESFSTYSEITIVIPNLPFQSMLGTSSDERILASLRLPFQYSTGNDVDGKVTNTSFSYYGDLIFNTLPSRSYLKITTDQQLYDCDVEVRLIRRDGEMDVMKLPFRGEFQVKLRLLQTQ